MPSARTFLKRFVATALALALGLGLGMALLDPYGVSPVGLPIQRPMMDINQRFMYPKVARDRTFDSAVFGTSTVRLLDPEQLNRSFGGRFANLAMNAATPWEQAQLAHLFLRNHRDAKTLLLGLDLAWCWRDADKRKLTFRAFPESFYDDNPLNDLPHLFNLKALEIGARLVGFHLKRIAPRIRGDGYDVFVPKETEYDLARARLHIADGDERVKSSTARGGYSRDALDAMAFPALAWLDGLLAAAKGGPKVILLVPPIHISRHPPADTFGASSTQECHGRMATLAKKHGAPLIDMQIDSPITREDSSYWDPLHYRVGVAAQIVDILKTASAPDATRGETFVRRDR